MNKRIKELAEQSGLQPYYDAQEGQIEKFAELIIQKCISSIYDSDISDKKQERLVKRLMYKFGFGVEE